MAAVARYSDLLGKMKNFPTMIGAAGLIGSNFIRPLLVPQSDEEIVNFPKATCDVCGQSGKSCGHCRHHRNQIICCDIADPKPLVMRLREARMVW